VVLTIKNGRKKFVNMMLNIILTSVSNEYMITVLGFKSYLDYDFLSCFRHYVQFIKLLVFGQQFLVFIDELKKVSSKSIKNKEE